MQTILRTKPENLDDLTVQVALVRPGPIQGKAVHPYIERRQRLREDPSYEPPADHPLLQEPLRETLGVIVFQDQVLDVAIHLAGFTVGEAEGLRRAMSRKRSLAALEAYRDALHRGRDRARASTRRSRTRSTTSSSHSPGFGFPKSHSAAFGLLAYQSAWLRHHYSAEFLAALLNAQPMGFYPPATLVRDGQRRGVETRPPDVNRSGVGCTIEDGAVRVGLKYVQGVGEDDAERSSTSATRTGRTLDPRARAARRRSSKRRARSARRVGRVRLLRTEAARAAVAARPRPARRRRVPGSRGEEKQLALPLEPTVDDARPARADACGSGCSTTTARRASRSACTRSS